MGVWACAATSAASPYSIAILPDTQYYAFVPDWHDTFYAQTQWIVDHRTAENIVFVSHEGDIVDAGWDEDQWLVADAAMGSLDTLPDLPYAAVKGNHDFGGPGDGYYVQYFGPSRYAGRSWYGGASTDGVNQWQTFVGGDGRMFLHLGLVFDPGAAARDWAQSVIDANPGAPTIITTHAYLGPNGEYLPGAQDFFDELIYPNPQVFMLLCGHVSAEARRTSVNIEGQEVYELLADYQQRPNGGDGWMRVMTFEPDEDQIEVYTYSPALDQYETDADSRFTLTVDFDERFGPAPAPGDFDRDGDVDAADIALLCANMGSPNAFYDLDDDGDVDEDDLVFHIETYLEYDLDGDGIPDGQGTFRGDFNTDGAVDIADLAILRGNSGQTGMGYAGGNANCDDVVDLADLTILRGNAGMSVTSPLPEPATLGPLALGALALLRSRRPYAKLRTQKTRPSPPSAIPRERPGK